MTTTVPVKSPDRSADRSAERPALVGRSLRRVPVQGRSVARVQRMLDACASLVDEVGYEGLTTTLLADRAGVAIGSVYQFFPDKRAVVQALGQRHLEAYLARLTERIAAAELTEWWHAADVAVDEYVRMHRTVPGFRALQFVGVVDPHQLDDERDNHTVIAGQLAEALATRFPVPAGDRLRFVLAVAVEVADALVRLAFRRDPAGDETVLAEAKAVVRDYLRGQLVPATATP